MGGIIPNKEAGITPGLLFPVTFPGGTTYDLSDPTTFGGLTDRLSWRNQPNIVEFLKSEVKQFPEWVDATNSVFDGFRRGIPGGANVPLPLAIVESLASQITGLPPGTWATVNQVTADLNALPGVPQVVALLTNTPGVAIADTETLLAAYGSNLNTFLGATNFTSPTFSVVDAATAFVNLVLAPLNLLPILIDGVIPALNIPDLDMSKIIGLLSSLGSGFPRTFPFTFGTSTSTTLADLVPTSQFQQLLDGIGGSPGHTVDSAVAAWRQAQQTIPSDIAQAIQDGAAKVEGAGSAISQIFQNFPGQNVVALGGDSIVNNVQALADGPVNALNGTAGVVGHAVTDFESELSSFLTSQYNNMTGGNKANASAADISSAQLSAAEQAASLSTQTAAILAQLPHFYGGSGAAGIGVEVPFIAGVPQGAGNAFTAITPTQYQYSGVNGYNGTAAAQTDSETASGIWSTIIPKDTWRGVYLRANASGSTKVWGRWRVVGDPGAGSSGGFYIPTDPSASFEFQIGCDVAGSEHVLQTFGPFPLWAYAGNVVIVDYSIQYVGVWWANYPAYLPVYGPGWVADTGHGMYLNSGNNSISIEATANTFALLYPSAGDLSVIDTAPVSLSGGAYRFAGYLDDEGAAGSQKSWAFWDSGPTSGPQKLPIATSESTPSATWTDLATIGPAVTINIGASGEALVTVSCLASNNTAGCTANMGFSALGANTIAAGSDGQGGNQNTVVAPGGAAPTGGSAQNLLTGLLPGPTTFTAKHFAGAGGTATFRNRDIAAIPL